MIETSTVLKEIRLFMGLAPTDLRKLGALAQRVMCSDGQVIMLEGDREAPVFFIIAGAVRVFHVNPDGREQTLIYLRPGDVFNLPTAFATDATAPISAMAAGPTELLTIRASEFRQAVRENPTLALAVLRDLSDKVYHLTGLTYDLSLRSVRQRLARFLLDQSKGQAGTTTRWTHEEMATRVGTVREVVSRTLRAFVKEGLVEKQRQRIVVVDVAGLEREAGK